MRGNFKDVYQREGNGPLLERTGRPCATLTIRVMTRMVRQGLYEEVLDEGRKSPRRRIFIRRSGEGQIVAFLSTLQTNGVSDHATLPS